MKYKSDWIYIFKRPVTANVAKVKESSVCLVSKLFHPERFEALAGVLFEQYAPALDPTKVLEGFLSVFTTGLYKSYDGASFNAVDPYLAVSSIRDIFSNLGMETVILWNAVILKKRILVIADSADKIVNIIRTIPQFAFHRKDWSILRPRVNNDQEHIDDLTSAGVYVAGSCDNALSSRSDLFDIIYSVSDHKVVVLPHASMSMKMCSVHREMGQILQEAFDAGKNSIDMLKEIAKKNSAMLNPLRSLAESCEDGRLTEEAVADKVPNEALRYFLVRFANAENLI